MEALAPEVPAAEVPVTSVCSARFLLALRVTLRVAVLFVVTFGMP